MRWFTGEAAEEEDEDEDDDEEEEEEEDEVCLVSPRVSPRRYRLSF